VTAAALATPPPRCLQKFELLWWKAAGKGILRWQAIARGARGAHATASHKDLPTLTHLPLGETL